MNELLPGILFTAEIGEEFPGEWGLPTLDTVMRMEVKGATLPEGAPHPSREGTNRTKSLVRRKIQYRFYRKPMATNLVTDFKSAHSMNSKMATLTQDVYRVLANCSPDTEMVEKCILLEAFIDRLKISNYPPKVAKKIITNGIITHRRSEVREAKKERNRH